MSEVNPVDVAALKAFAIGMSRAPHEGLTARQRALMARRTDEGEAMRTPMQMAMDPCNLNGQAETIEQQAAEIERLRRDCAELYQVIGTMAEHCPDPSSPAIVKALDNASDAANGDPRRHSDLLPFVLPYPHQEKRK